MDFSNFLSDVLATILGGATLTLLFFLIKEKYFPIPNLSGKWYFETITTKSAYNPYKNMVLKYEAILLIEGNKVEGTTEKVYEKTIKNQNGKEYVGKNRIRGKIKGYIQKNYFTRDKLFIHIIEDGQLRKSTTYYELEVILKEGQLKGIFSSMIAESTGSSIWKRN
jgi:hypothetical protein